MGGGHGPAPEKLVLPPDGIDPYPPQSEWTCEYGGKPLEDYPDDVKADPLKLAGWYNYNDKPLPELFPTQEQNARLWQSMLAEKALDSHPIHEIHPKDLPDYHYWPMIQNDREPKFTGQVSELVQFQYHSDQTEIPRFHKSGVPKTPPQEQIWYTPLDHNGRCDYRAIIARWAAHSSPFSRCGWADRYLRWVHQDPIFQYNTSLGIIDITKPILYKHRELNRVTRFFRNKRGSFLPWPIKLGVFYLFFIGAYSGANNASYQALQWNDDVWNYDIHYMQYFRQTGAWHPPC